MTDLRKAAEMLIKALDDGWVERGDDVAIVLRQALAQPDQKPVDIHCPSCLHSFSIVPVAKREWVGLTDDERRHYNNRLSGSGVAEDIEAKLKERQL